MKPVILLYPLVAILASCASHQSMPSPDSLDRSGIVSSGFSDRRRAVFKGFLPEQGQRKVAILVRHSNPTPGRVIHCITPDGKPVFRTIRKVVNVNFLKDQLRYPEMLMFGDVAIALVDSPFPDSCKTYPIGTMNTREDLLVNVNQFGEIRTFTASRSGEVGADWWICGEEQEEKRFLLGDSGTPWFKYRKGRWQVVSITSKGPDGEGPHLGHPVFRWPLGKVIASLLAE
jgi:hypothetical protein